MPVFKLLLTPKSWPILPIFVDPLKLLQNTVPTKKVLFHFLISAKGSFFQKILIPRFVICIPTFYITELWKLIVFFFYFAAPPASQTLPSCPCSPLNCQDLRDCQFPCKFQSQKFKFSNSGKGKVHTAWTVNDVLVAPYPCIALKGCGSTKMIKGCGSTKMIKGYGLTKTSLTVHTECLRKWQIHL